MSTKLILSIDGGASSTRIGYIDINTGEIVKQLKCGPTQIRKQDKEVIRELYMILRDSSQELKDVVAVVMGIAGMDSDLETREAKAIYTPLFKKLCPNADIHIVTDIDLVLSFCDTTKPLNIALISGTGSNCVAKYKNSRAKAGGLGHTLTDQGSGYYIGYKALRSCVEVMDKRSEDSILPNLLKEHLGFNSLPELKNLISVQKYSKKEIASLTPLVVEGLRKKDKICGKIILDAAEELVRHVYATDKQLGTQGAKPTSLVCSGSIFKILEIRTVVNSRVNTYFENVLVNFLDKPPFYGGYLYYKNQIGLV